MYKCNVKHQFLTIPIESTQLVLQRTWCMHLPAPAGWSNSCSTSPLPQHCLWGRERVPFHALYLECCRHRTVVLHTGTWPPLELAVKLVLHQALLPPAEAQPHPHRGELICQGATEHSSLPSPAQQYRLARSWLQSSSAYLQAVISWVMPYNQCSLWHCMGSVAMQW